MSFIHFSISNHFTPLDGEISASNFLLNALSDGQIRPFGQLDWAATDLSPQLSCVWLQPRLSVKAAHWLINYAPFVLVVEIISIIIFEFEFSSTAILRVTPRLTTHSFVTTHHCNKEF